MPEPLPTAPNFYHVTMVPAVKTGDAHGATRPFDDTIGVPDTYAGFMSYLWIIDNSSL
jgi:hypothetical protein